MQLLDALKLEALAIHAKQSRSAGNSMSSYMNRHGGCFDGNQAVDTSPRTGPRRVCELRRGDVLANGAVVLAVVVMHMPPRSQLCVINCVRISPWHPVSVGNSAWLFPASVATIVSQPIDFLYVFHP